ncbi:hypothetical protein [Streptomyces sp. NPDC037389]|uniref:hypothetical protein n=1 Tax=Streptomyces sp. NPDC037389 TaxID=3155369 RepID=UPI0033C81A06
MKRTRTMARMGMVFAAALALLVPAGTAHAAARSVQVALRNDTGCTLNFHSKYANGGKWVGNPPDVITKDGLGDYVDYGQGIATESNGLFTGTEGRIVYTTSNCTKANLFIAFHWINPYAGSNSYDAKGTSRAFGCWRDEGRNDNVQVLAVFALNSKATAQPGTTTRCTQ